MDYTARHKAMLKAIADGRGALASGSLAVDGLWCDFTATNDLLRGGLVRAERSTTGPALLTATGMAVLELLTT